MSDGTISLTTQQPATGVLVATVGGEINFSGSPALRAKLTELIHTRPARLVIDLGGVSYMDSSGVATLVEALQAQTRQGGVLVLCNLQPRVQSIFEISRLTAVFRIAPDAGAAATA